MNISKFLFIDAALAIAAIPLLFGLKGRNNKNSSLFRSTNKKELLEKKSINLPDKEKLLDLEKLARRESSGIDFDLLVGNWKFVSVWKKDTDDDSVFSSLLRVFSAKIEIKKDISPHSQLKFSISASIQFGLFSIKFSGSGYLKGKRPYLPFSFNLIEFKLGSNVLLSSSIKEPVGKEKSFFALIASDESEGWLSARGQGGALILWLKE